MKRRIIALCAAFAAVGLPTGSVSASTPAIGPRPGPEILYREPASAPMLENADGWQAEPLMVSGAAAYRGGEYLYQDYIYDSFGANTTDVPFLPPDPVPNAADVAFGGQTGDLVYPTNEGRYGNDAADILEFRARVEPDAIRYRVTLNTMLAADAAAIAIGIDRAPGGRSDWGYGIGSLGALGLDTVIVAAGASASSPDVDGVSASVDTTRNQIDIRVPITPDGAVWRHYLVAGVSNAGAFAPIGNDPTETLPGGAHDATEVAPVFNVGFRFDEPAINGDLEGLLAAPTAATGSRTVGAGSYRDHAQALALAARDISAFRADIDLGKLADGVTDESMVPRTGLLNRLYASRLDLGEGARTTRPMLRGQIQPYALYVPTTYDGSPAPFTLALHSLSCSYNQYAVFAPNLYRDLGEARGALMLTTEGRGPDGWYHDEAEVDLFEAWADVAARYAIDWERVTINGYSMGGYATYRFASLYPDLFAAGFAVVGPADESITGGPFHGVWDTAQSSESTIPLMPSTRHVPLMLWNGTNDELVPIAGPLRHERVLDDLGYPHDLRIFPGFDHFLLSIVDDWTSAVGWLDETPVVRDPAQVVFTVSSGIDRPGFGLVHDHAYWLSEVRAATPGTPGTVNALSLANGGGALLETGGHIIASDDPAPYVEIGIGRGLDIAPRNPEITLELELANVGSLTIWVERAGLDAEQPITIRASSTSLATLTLAGTFGSRTVVVQPGVTAQTIEPAI